MKKSFILLLILFSPNLFANMLCNELLMGMSGTAEAAKFGEELAKLPVAKFDPRFCKGLAACNTVFNGDEDKLKELKNSYEGIKNGYSGLPKHIENIKKSLTDLTAELKKLEQATPPRDEAQINSKKTTITNLEKSMKDTEDKYALYLAHLKDPKKVPHPMVADGYPASFEEAVLKAIKDNVEEYENIPASIKESQTTLADHKKKLSASKASKELDMIGMYEAMIAQTQKELTILSELQVRYAKVKGHLTSKTLFMLKSVPEHLAVAEIPDNCDTANEYFQSAVGYANDKKAGTCGLSAEELAVLSYYMGDGYSCMNTYMRVGKKEPNVDYVLQSLNRALAKLPSYQGFVNRGSDLPPEIRNQHKVGSIVSYAAFTSASTDSGFGGSDLFKIYSKTGKPVMSFNAPGEYEVLFKANTKFKVLEVTEKDGKNFYVMKELGEKETAGEDPNDKVLLGEVAKHRAPAAVKPGEAGATTKGSDEWACPLDDKVKVPPLVIQKAFPPNQ